MKMNDEERILRERFSPYFDRKISKIKSIILDRNRFSSPNPVNMFESTDYSTVDKILSIKH